MNRERRPVGPGDPAAPTGRPRVGRSALGPALRRAWIGYQRRLQLVLAEEGFADQGFPDGRVLRICSAGTEVTISGIGRELGITRQGASKVVASMRQRGYVTVAPSPSDGREKVVYPTERALDYLAAHRAASVSIERSLRQEVGEDAFASLEALLEVLGGDDQPRLRDHISTLATLHLTGSLDD